MTDLQNDTVSQQRAYIDDLRSEGSKLTGAERVEHEALVSELLSDLALAETVQRQAAEDLARAGELAQGGTSKIADREVEPQPVYLADRTKIGWLSDKKTPVEVTKRTTPGGKVFHYANITSLSNATRVNARVMRPRQVQQVEERVAQHISAKLDSDDQQSINLRPLEASPTRSHTSLNPYKDDNVTAQGFNNNDIRVLVLEDSSTEQPTFLVAHITVGHDNQQAIYNH